MKTVLANGNALINGTITQKTIVLDDGKISDILDSVENIEIDGKVIDCTGKYIFPGFIDQHIHGSGGGFSQNITEDQYSRIVKTQSKFGITSIVITLIGATDDELVKSSNMVQKINDEKIGSNILGLHIEGPWISPKKIGYLSPDLFQFVGDQSHAKEVVSKCNGYLKIVTLAPELENIDEVMDVLKDNNIVMSCGHTDGNYETTKHGVSKGIKSFTHLWNMSGPIQAREPGVVGYALSDDDCYVELVADGFHVHPSNIKNTIRTKPTNRICLVTDAMVVTGTEDTTYSFMGIDGIKVINGRTCGPNNAIIGSVLTLDKAVRNVLEWTDISLESAVCMVTENPAKLLGIYPKKGTIQKGSDADIAIFDTDLNCICTIIGGEIKTS